jgi:metal-responsive CopG/Arc/MetJ family transcriptional regulator
MVIAFFTSEIAMELIVRLPDAVSDALAALAEETGRSTEELIEEALRDYLEESSATTPRSIGIHAARIQRTG